LDIYFKNRRLANACNSSKECQRTFGAERSKKIQQRLVELKAADSLADVKKIPQARCHPLKGDREGQFSVTVSGNYRIIFMPYRTLPKKDEGGINYELITEIRVIGIEDYHGD
jgi:plasmid maintenance system killer protein